ncbi:MAG: arginine--tRNA ligase [Candidatus Omnitrophica bacterium]|nr:arginine--tRNA ligase [Candidatus Omnitrophota bacterium]MBU1869286.1 arginine--tRNA ligase [Candidatus Omnitrophota bacterium]
MEKNIQELLIQLLKDSLVKLKLDSVFQEELILDFPTDERFGDFSTNLALRLSKLAKRSPRDIAISLIDSLNGQLEGSPAEGFVKEIKVEGAGFINFYLSEKYFYEQLKRIIVEGRDAHKINLGRGKNVLIEFVSANPTGSLSVAHARQAAVGDSLANTLEFIGFKVSREYYLNDEGNQINILGGSVELRGKELAGEKVEFPENYYQGDYIYDIAKLAKEKGVRTEGLGDFAAEYILEIIKKELEDFGVRFDCWYSQKELQKSAKIDSSFEFLRKNNLLYEQEGALWFKSTEFGDDKDRVVIKSDGSYTYLAPDIAYHEEKYKRGFSWLINLWGPDHHGYISRLKASVQAFGHSADSLCVVIVQLATIFREGKVVHMSTRKGQYITLREVLDEVGKDASRFFFLMRRTSSHLDFDLDVAKKQTSENPVYYVQYAHARICSILRSASFAPRQDTDLSLLKEKEEIALIKKILQFSSVLNVCLVTLDPYMLTVYLQELAESFHKFYDLHRVLGQHDALTEARLSLIDAVKITLATGLELVGVSKPEKM